MTDVSPYSIFYLIRSATADTYPVVDAVRYWYQERDYYNYCKAKGGKMPNAVVGHYTQVVWENTTHVGCGRKKCPDMIIIFCNYWPTGNWPKIRNGKLVLLPYRVKEGACNGLEGAGNRVCGGMAWLATVVAAIQLQHLL